VDGKIDPFELVGPWIGYRTLRKKKNTSSGLHINNNNTKFTPFNKNSWTHLINDCTFQITPHENSFHEKKRVIENYNLH